MHYQALISYHDFIDINGTTCDSYSMEYQEGSTLCSQAQPTRNYPNRTALTDCAVCGGGHTPCTGRDGAHDNSCVNTIRLTCDSCNAGYTGDGDTGCHDM